MNKDFLLDFIAGGKSLRVNSIRLDTMAVGKEIFLGKEQGKLRSKTKAQMISHQGSLR